MAKVSEERFRVWLYRELMGTLGKTKRKTLLDKLDEKKLLGELDLLERKIWTAMKLQKTPLEQREFLKRELKLWDKRTARQYKR